MEKVKNRYGETPVDLTFYIAQEYYLHKGGNMSEIFERWDCILRGKASKYEHKARKNGEEVSSPDLDDVCNEMRAFFEGLGIRKGSKDAK